LFGDYKMRKTQFALAALALVASTAAMADGVTVYGTVDVGVSTSGGTQAVYGGGNNGTTHFGITGSEDLGNGLKAGFNLQSGFSATNGASGYSGGGNTNLFNRAANISLSNENVGLTLGNQFSNVVLQSGFVVGGNGVGGDGVNVPGVVRLFGGLPGGYTTTSQPNLAADGSGTATNPNPSVFFIPQAAQVSFNGGGISGDLMVRGVEKSGTESGYTGLTLRSSIAGVNAGAGYQKISQIGASQTSMMAFANTQIGDVRVNGAYSRNTGDAGDSNGYMVGASMPVAKDLSAGVSYARSNVATLGSILALSSEYSLSKRTMAYATYARFSVANAGGYANDSAATLNGKNLLTVGLKHSF